MAFAVSATDGLVHHELMMGGMNTDRFNAFLVTTIERVRNDPAPKVVIFDNAPAHRRAQNVQCPNNVTLRWQPPYSPFLNIVENCFSSWKAAIKRGGSSRRYPRFSS